MNRTDKEAYVQELSARLQRTPFGGSSKQRV
jgi:hypothetical protein